MSVQVPRHPGGRGHWRPIVLLLLAASVTVANGEAGQAEPRRTPYYDQQIAAARLAKACQETIKSVREARGIPIEPRFDRNRTGMIGRTFSPITTCFGALPLKRTTTNPNFAALFVRYFKELHLEEGDVVAIGSTGSFPALVVAVLAAAQVLDLEPILICSPGSSQYGANIPELNLFEILKIVNDRGLIRGRPAAALLDVSGLTRRIGLLRKSPRQFKDILARAEVPVLFSDSLAVGMRLCREVYDRYAAGRPIRCFVNLGAERAFSGDSLDFVGLPDGLLDLWPVPAKRKDHSLLLALASEGVPIISFIWMDEIAVDSGLTLDPIPMQAIGEGPVYLDSTATPPSSPSPPNTP